MARWVLGVSDTHANHKLALLPPGVELEDEGPDGEIVKWSPSLNPIQKKLWEWFVSDLAWVEGMTKGEPLTVVHHGDITHGNAFMRELISTRISDQLRIAIDVLDTLASLRGVRRLLVIKGTEVHEFGEGSAPDVAQMVMEVRRPGIEVRTANHFRLKVDGRIFDMAHHGPPAGARYWLHGNVVELYGRDAMMQELAAGETPADVISRGHFHRFATRVSTVEARGRIFETRSTLLPSYSFLDYHARKVARSPARVTTGLVLWEVPDGGGPVVQHVQKRTVDFRTQMEVEDRDSEE